MRYSVLITFVCVLLNLNSSFSQCKSFAKEVCKPKLENYIHDGNYNGVILNKGEEIELHKAFFSEQNYRMVICREDHLPPIHFKLLNTDLTVIYDNENDGYSELYDFELKDSKTLIISIEFVSDDESNGNVSGCVSILFGLKY